MPMPQPRETFNRYNTADYLKDEESILAYLEAAMEQASDEPAPVALVLRNISRAT